MKNKNTPPVILLNMAVDVINGKENEVIISKYVERVSESGAVPMLIPSIEKEQNIETLLDLADGVVFIGGRDYDARDFGEEPHPMAGRNRLRPHFDIAFAQAVLKRKMPVLGICAGCQLLNIVTGGKLIQHLDNAEEHKGGVYHSARIISDGFFARAVNGKVHDEISVNSYHHQAVHPEYPGKNIKVTALSFDGSIEAIEIPGERMVLGVQFHPERMDDLGPGFFDLLRDEALKFRRR